MAWAVPLAQTKPEDLIALEEKVKSELMERARRALDLKPEDICIRALKPSDILGSGNNAWRFTVDTTAKDTKGYVSTVTMDELKGKVIALVGVGVNRGATSLDVTELVVEVGKDTRAVINFEDILAYSDRVKFFNDVVYIEAGERDIAFKFAPSPEASGTVTVNNVYLIGYVAEKWNVTLSRP